MMLLQTPVDKQIKVDNKIVVYSLTARSIPRQFRQELKNQEEAETSLTSSLEGIISKSSQIRSNGFV